MKKLFVVMMAVMLLGTILSINMATGPVSSDVTAIPEMGFGIVSPDATIGMAYVENRGMEKGVPWATGLTLLITVIGWLGFGTYWNKFKIIIKELKELLQTVQDALSDNKLTEDELRQIIKEAKEVLQVFTLSKHEQLLAAKRK